MQPSSAARWTRWILLGFGALAFAVVITRADVGASANILVDNWPWILVALFPYLLQLGLDSFAWKELLRSLGRNVAWRRLLAVRLSTEAVLMSLPFGSLLGETLKPYLLNKTDQVPVAETVASIGAKKCLLVFAQALYLAIAVTLGWSILADHSNKIVGIDVLPWLAAAGVAMLAGVGFGLGITLLDGEIGDRTHKLLRQVPIKRFRTWIEERRDPFTDTDMSFQVIRRAGGGSAFFAFTLLTAAWLVEAGETYVLLRVIGVDLPFVDVLVMEATVVFLRDLAVFVPAGLGVQDAGYVAFLDAFGFGGPMAGAFVLLKRAKELVWVCVGYVTLFVLQARVAAATPPAAPSPPAKRDAALWSSPEPT
jgi:uncharacterized protein (TIRG00374 family)